MTTKAELVAELDGANTKIAELEQRVSDISAACNTRVDRAINVSDMLLLQLKGQRGQMTQYENSALERYRLIRDRLAKEEKRCRKLKSKLRKKKRR